MHQASALPPALRLPRVTHERGEDAETTEEMVEHDAPHPSSIDPEEDE